ncbi:hypothetical protein PGQ11_007962 [Apiospora arundinis]|uniref:DNA helicase n=1 Tax=Apiospora arundinis TaxID=335852 RepID=A0ABR2IX09_9PEZI
MRTADDIPGLWRSFEESLSDRLRFHVRNISFLRASAEDAAADRKHRGFDQDFEEAIDPQAFGGAGAEQDRADSEEESRERQEYWNAFLDTLSGAARRSSIKDMAISSALRSLNEDAEAIEEAGAETDEDGRVIEQSRGRRFYTELQDVQDAPLRGVGLLGREEMVGIMKAQKKEDANITAGIQGAGRGDVPPTADLGRVSAVRQWTADTVGAAGAQIRLESGPYTSYMDVALALARSWTLNKQQALALLLPAAFLDERGARLQEEEGPQHFQYVGGEGGTGKSRVIHAIKDMFRLKDAQQTLLLTGASGNAAAEIPKLRRSMYAALSQFHTLSDHKELRSNSPWCTRWQVPTPPTLASSKGARI